MVDVEFADPRLSMAFEEAIACSVGEKKTPNTLRFWRNFNTVVIGRSQCPTCEVNLESCLIHRVNIVRRFTGGGTVYQDSGNLNFALSIKRNVPILKNDIYEAIRLVGCSVAKGLRKVGLNAEFRPKNSIEINSKKISGMAGWCGKAFFVHGSLLVSSGLKVLYDVLNSTVMYSGERGVRSVKKEVTTVYKELNRKVEFPLIKTEIKNAVETAFNAEIVEDNLTGKEETLAKSLYDKKYSNIEWNLAPCRKCPNKATDEQIFELLVF